MNKKPAKQTVEKELMGEEFDALPDLEKERIFQEIENAPPGKLLAESRPMNKKEREWWNEWKRRRGGRPKVGNGVKIISLSMERDLLKRADSFARSRGLKRSELVARGLELVMRRAKAS
jgi:hypothetical protein